MFDSADNLVVEYWYNPRVKSNGQRIFQVDEQRSLTTEYEALAELNSFRYRGFVYDEETELYYLHSQYYNPKYGRFINADTTLGRFPSLQTHNLYQYCYCDSIGYNDVYGSSPVDIDCFYQNAAASDSPGLFGDAIGMVGALGIVFWGWIFGASSSVSTSTEITQNKLNSTLTPSPSSKTTSTPTPAPTPSCHQEYFPENLLLFQPFGLILHTYPPKTTVPTILMWSIPGTKVSLFEWSFDSVKWIALSCNAPSNEPHTPRRRAL